MIRYLLEKQMQKEAEEHGKKIMIYAGMALAGVGAYCVYKAVKKSKMKYDNENINYLGSSDVYDEEDEQNELEKKVDEFNSRRINYENSPHVSQEEIANYVENTQDGKEEVEINEDEYKEEDYENYEYSDGHIVNKK